MSASSNDQSRVSFRWTAVNPVAYVISMSTHLVAILLGGAISSLMQTDAWPSPARHLSGAQVVLALPGHMVVAEGVAAGDPVFIHKKLADNDGDNAAGQSCVLSSSPFRLLATGTSILLAQDVVKVSASALGRIREVLVSADAGGNSGSSLIFKVGRRDGVACSQFRTSDPDVVVDRDL